MLALLVLVLLLAPLLVVYAPNELERLIDSAAERRSMEQPLLVVGCALSAVGALSMAALSATAGTATVLSA